MPEDYIMRLIQQVAAMLAAIVAKRREGKPQEAQAQVDATCFQTIGLPLSTVKRLTPDALAQHLAQSGGNCCARSVLLAELLDSKCRTSRSREGASNGAGSLYSRLLPDFRFDA